MTVFDLASCVSITSSLLPSCVNRVLFNEQENVSTYVGSFLFIAVNVAAIYATKYSLNFHSYLHSDVYKGVEAKQEPTAIKTEVGLSGSDFAQQSIHTMRSVVDFTAGCLITHLRPFQRRAYFLSAIINALSVSVIFQRVSLMFRLPAIKQKPNVVIGENGQVNTEDCNNYKVVLNPVVEYRILRPLFERMGSKKSEEDICTICLDDLKEKVAICPKHHLHAQCVQDYCLSKLNHPDFQNALKGINETIYIQEKAAHCSPTASFFELIGCSPRAADKMSIWLIDNTINSNTVKSQLVRYENRINPCSCTECRVHSPFFDYQVEATGTDGKKLPVEVGYCISRDQLREFYGSRPFLPEE